MRRIITIFQTTISAVLLACLAVIGTPHVSEAAPASAPSLVISQLKITSNNGQFVTLYNTTDTTLDMSKYQLEYFNSYDLTKTSSSRLLALSGSVPPHSYIMVSDDSVRLCYQLSIDSMSLGFSSTAGMLEVVTTDQDASGGAVNTILQDYVSWSKNGGQGAQALPSSGDVFLQRQPADVLGNPSITIPGAGSWQAVQHDSNNPCDLMSVVDGSYIPSGMATLLPSSEPPATIVSIGREGSANTNSLPSADVGLMAPSITELLPNPNGTGNDSTDEFIELYNPNAASFDLSGFSLAAGTTTLRHYAFPTGTKLLGHSFTAFYSANTKLSLSNNGSVVKLLDPFSNSISASSDYGSAKDGVAWALAKGKWYWTAQPTPGKPNIIKAPTDIKKISSKKSANKQKNIKSKISTAAGTYSDNQSSATGSPIHVTTLAIIGGLALLYGAYEYRADMASYVERLRRNYKDR